jgi:uncharacterized delta-60 repeat protein
VSTPIGSVDTPRALFTQGSGVLLSNRRITVAGYSQTSTNKSFAFARYTFSGALDTTFNGTGKLLLSFGAGADDEAYAALYDGGQILAAGSSAVNQNNNDFALVRLNSDGSRDATFGSNGVVTADILDRDASAKGLSIQSDGKFVVAGSADNGDHNIFALARYNLDGSLDSSFASNGKVTTDLFTNRAEANAVQLQADGRIVAAGFSYNGSNDDFAVVRYNTNGTLDSTFGSGGKVTTPIGTARDDANALAIQPDGKIVLAGASDTGSYSDFALARYNTNGTLDTSFGNNGKVITAVSSQNDGALAVRLQSDGKIVAAGYTVVSGSDADFALVRYNTNGSRDFSFGNLGIVTTDMAGGTVDEAFTMAIQPDSKIILGGFVLSGGNAFVGLARYATNGTLDTTFGSSGKVITQIGAVSDYCTTLALQPDGKILAGCATKIGSNYQYAVLRLNTNGSPDTSFGVGGAVTPTFGDGGDDYGWSVAVDSIGRIVLAGDANSQFGVMRFLGDPFLKILSLNRLGDGHVVLNGLGVPNRNHTVLGATNPVSASFGSLGAVIPDAAGLWQYDDASAVGLTRRFYRLSLP